MPSVPGAHTLADLAEMHALLHSEEKRANKVEKSMLKAQLAMAKELDYVAYCTRHGIHGRPQIGTVMLELIASLTLSALRFATHVPHLFILWVVTYMVSEILKFIVQQAIYRTLHDVFEPVRHEVVKDLDAVIDAVVGAIAGAYNAVAGGITSGINVVTNALSGGHGTHIHAKPLTIKHPVIPIEKEAMGLYYADLVDMRKLCEHLYSNRLLLMVHMAMRVLTLGTLCQTFRQWYPSPVLRWLGDFFYGNDFVSPHQDNCHITARTVVCFAWNIWELPWFFFWATLTITALHALWPTFKLLARVLYAWAATAVYVSWHPTAPNKMAVLNHHLDKHARHVGRVEHIERAHRRRIQAAKKTTAR